MEAIENICGVKGEGLVNHCTITRWLGKFRLHCKNLNNQTRSGGPKIVHSKAVLQDIKINLVSST